MEPNCVVCSRKVKEYNANIISFLQRTLNVLGKQGDLISY